MTRAQIVHRRRASWSLGADRVGVARLPALRWTGALFALCAATLTAACGSVSPSLSGGSSTPDHRQDVALGGAARVPTGELRTDPTTPDERNQYATRGETITPIAFVRRGISDHTDLELMVVGPGGRVGVRHEWVLEEAITRPVILLAPSALVAYVGDPGDAGGSGGVRARVDLPLTYSVDFGSLFEFWVGPRVGYEMVRGRFADAGGAVSDAAHHGIRLGAVLGMAAGHRRIHALLELGVDYELWWERFGGNDRSPRGFVLVPAFAIRVRI